MPEANVLSPVAQMGSRFGYLERAPTPTTDMARGDDRAAITRRCTKTCSSIWPSADSAAVRRSRHFRSASNATSAPSSAATQTPAVWPMISSSGPGVPRPSTKPAGGRPSASCCRPRFTSIARRSRHSTRCCASTRDAPEPTWATLDGANLIKLHRHSGKVSYLSYPDFETDPHPALRRSVKLSLRTREIDCFDYAASTNPPVLHRKETFLASDHPLHAKFARLTQQEEKHGLLDDSSAIGTREGWSSRLAERGFA